MPRMITDWPAIAPHKSSLPITCMTCRSSKTSTDLWARHWGAGRFPVSPRLNQELPSPFSSSTTPSAPSIIAPRKCLACLASTGGIGIDPSAVTPRPDRLAGVPLKGPGTVAEWFNTGAFADAIGHFGTSGRGVLIGPGLNNWDIALIKNFKISERFSAQIRGEFFNAFNHVSFDAVDDFTDDSTFGQLTGDHLPRNIQLGAKLYW